MDFRAWATEVFMNFFRHGGGARDMFWTSWEKTCCVGCVTLGRSSGVAVLQLQRCNDRGVVEVVSSRGTIEQGKEVLSTETRSTNPGLK